VVRREGVSRFDVWLVALDPTVGSEIRKTRPCVVVSPDGLNRQLRTIVVCPMTSRVWDAPFRVTSRFAGQDGSVSLDQIRTVDRHRLVRRLGRLDEVTAREILQRLGHMFAP
jgi:mRNA interferase MazF